MPSLREYLPGIPTEYWKLYAKVITPANAITVKAESQDQGILPEPINSERGLFSHFILSANSNQLVVNLTIDDITTSANLSTISTGGYVGYYVPGTPWLSVASSSIPLYVVNVLYPNLVPFYRNVNLTVSNPSTTEIIISGLAIDAYILNPGFYKELAKLISGNLP